MIFVGGPARQTRTTVAATTARRRIPRCSNPLPPPTQNNVRDGGAHCTAVAAPSSHLHRRMYNNNRRRRRQVPHVRIEYATTATNISTCYTRPTAIDTSTIKYNIIISLFTIYRPASDFNPRRCLLHNSDDIVVRSSPNDA